MDNNDKKIEASNSDSDTIRFYMFNIAKKTVSDFIIRFKVLPRQEYSSNHRWLSFSAARGRKIIVWLAVADLLASLGVFARSSLWINYKNIMPSINDDTSVVFCAVSSAWIQYFYTATWIWTLCYAIDVHLLLEERESRSKLYHLAAWSIPAVLTAIGLSLLYIPDANCHTSPSLSNALSRILPNYFATYLPIATVMIVNPWLYHYSTKDMERIITTSAGQFTSRERDIMDAVRIKFSVINIVFYICWLPNFVNGILLWTLWFHLPASWVITIWYIMALMNPLQALFNCLVYRRWNFSSERLLLPWRKLCKTTTAPEYLSPESSTTSTSTEENLPLLQNAPRIGINGYTNYR